MCPKIDVEETNLEDLIVLGEDKLINIIIEYPTENDTVKVKAKIKQLTMKELRNIDVTKPSMETNVNILTKALFKQDETPFEKELVLALPIGVVNEIAKEILKVSGVDRKDMGF
jgi:sensor c-di-GMP phosphodiesterase-like protein